MELKEIGFSGKLGELINVSSIAEHDLARVIVEHKERYIVQSVEGIFNAEIIGNLRYTATGRADFPAVGDWVRITMMDKESAIIMEVLPRTNMLQRQAVGKTGEIQIIASNIDCGFIVQAIGHDFNLKRLERYLSICFASDIEPVILLTKIDLVQKEEVEVLLQQIEERTKDVRVIALSSESMDGYDELNSFMQPYKNYCFLGSSGVGKSTIVNRLKGEAFLKTSEISASTNKGRHTTSHRELIILPNESIVIDTPGMRELGMTDQIQGIEMTYDEITELAEECKYKDCTHTTETKCAVLEALENGDLSEEVFQNYQKLMREQKHFSSTAEERRKKDKDFGKMVKGVKKERKNHKF